ncbi:MAG: PspC domain-containing protein [Dysgonomonas sp.]
MKPTVKVSIGGLAFNLEDDAYRVLNDYLQSLRTHFQGNPEADEIIADIESRMSELLQMRTCKSEGAVSIDDALEIIKIMGNPKDFGDASTEEPQAKSEESTVDNSFRGKRLFRDMDNKVVAGVCSGIGHYFRIDSTLIRLIFIGLFLFLFFFKYSGFSSLIIVGIYAVLWMIMPVARTFNQKLVMTGADPSIENIEERPLRPIRKYRGSGVTTFFSVLLNIIVGFIAVLTFLLLIGVIGSLVWLYLDTDILATANYMVLFGYNTLNIKLAIILVSILPIVGLFCLMLKILRRSSFSTFTLISFIMGLIIWLGSAFYLGNKTAKFVYAHQEHGNVTDTISLNTTSNKLYIQLGSEYLDANTQPNVPIVLYKGDKLKYRNICVLPNVSVIKDTTLTEYKMEINKKNYGENRVSARRKADAMQFNYNVTDSLLILNPQWYDNDNPWNLEMYKITIRVPKDKDVELGMPLQERYYTTSFRFNRHRGDFYRYHWFRPPFVHFS